MSRNYKYNYTKMKMEFFEGPWKTAGSYLREKYQIMKPTGAIEKRIQGWTKEKELFLKQSLQFATKKLLSERVEDEKQILIRQQRIGRLLQSKGIKSLKDLSPKNLEECRRLIATGVKIELEALGLDDKRERSSNLTQVNVNLPKTRFDKVLDGLDYTGVLKFLAEIRREKTRRDGIPPTIEGSTKTG